jgi:hypothetical protein
MHKSSFWAIKSWVIRLYMYIMSKELYLVDSILRCSKMSLYIYVYVAGPENWYVDCIQPRHSPQLGCGMTGQP